ncbi:DUF4855 domain-containing protein [Alicyclobacillaceae bacterium I2511]|nr:DUF4855 domain-containing protein [Alicyclobacillaceae bacterium I2511]
MNLAFHRRLSTLSMAAAGTLMIATVAPGQALATQTSPSYSPNLALNSQIQWSSIGPADSAFQASEQAYPAPLTSSSSWHGFLREVGRDITVQLPQPIPLGQVSLQFEQDNGAGVTFPRYMQVEAMVNGQWSVLGDAYTAVPRTDRRATVQTLAVAGQGVVTQEVRIRVPVGVWIFARGLTVTEAASPTGGSSTNAASGASFGSVASPSVSAPANQGPLTPGSTGAHGIRNMLLVYFGTNAGQTATWSPSDFVPMLSYQSPSGMLSGRMFNTMLFGPYGPLPSTQSDWQTYLQNLFATGQQLDALNTAASQVNTALNTPGFQEKVVIALPYPSFGSGVWGNIGGNPINLSGSPQDPNALHAREAAVAWFMQQFLAQWQAAHYSNLQLSGFYWNQETVRATVPNESQLIAHTAQTAHAEGMPLFWIPMYDGQQATRWQSLGFDAAWLQPNFIEAGLSANPARLTGAEQLANGYGMGLEVELQSENVYNPAYRYLYQETLDQFSQAGYGPGVSHAFYAGVKLLVDAAQSTDPNIRAIYNETYQFLSQP